MQKIPTPEQRIKIYTKIKSIDPHSEPENNPSAINTEPLVVEGRKMSKEDVARLVERLTQDTRKDWVVKEQVQRILEDKKRRERNDCKVEERLIQAGKQTTQKLQTLREQHEKSQLETLKPVPTISEKAKNRIDIPFLQRVDTLASRKEDLLQKLNNKYEPQFKPQLNPYSLWMAQLGSLDAGFLERQGKWRERMKEAEQERARLMKEEEMREVTFQPEINPKSRLLAAQSQPTSISRTTEQPPNPFNFHPQINSKSRALAKTRANASTECHERLYSQMQRISVKKMDRRREQNEKFTHKPVLNRKSLRIVEGKAGNGIRDCEMDDEEFQEVLFGGRDQLFGDQRTHNTEYQQSEQNQFLTSQAEQIKYLQSYQPRSSQPRLPR